MFNLTQKAWNNVIIFAMLFMVYLFSVSNKLMLKNTEEGAMHFLLPEHGVVMRIEFAQVVLERVGQSWRIQGVEQHSSKTLSSLVQNWGQVVVEPQPYIMLESPYVVSMQLAGEAQTRVYQLAQVEQGLLINYEGRSFLAAQTNIASLIPQ